MASLEDRSNDPKNTPTRHVLSNVSPNVRLAATDVGRHYSKPASGSPLNRTLTAALEVEQGFTYLKKRKRSDDDSLDLSDKSMDPRLYNQYQHSTGHSNAEVGSLGPLVTPTIQELSPTEPNTPTPSDLGDEPASSSEGRKSFSSLINYNASSQIAAPSHQMPGLVFKGPSYAELLRLRLRVAMFKVRTNQVHVPFAELRVHSDDTVDGSSDPLQPESGRPSGAFIAESTPRRLQVQSLRPRASREYEALAGDAYSPQRNPTLDRTVLGQPLSTPEGSKRFAWQDENDLTSSTVKGRVAEGLLGLRYA